MNKLYFDENFEILRGHVKPLLFQMHTLNYKAHLHKYLLLICTGILILLPNALAAGMPTVPAFPGAEGYGAITINLICPICTGAEASLGRCPCL